MNMHTADAPEVKPAQTLLVSNAVLPKSGGFPKTMRKFAVALSAEIVSFTSPDESAEEREAFPEVTHVPTGRGFLSNWYSYAGKMARMPAEKMAGRVDLLSCHIMLRYHATWVQRIARTHDIPYWFVAHGQLDPYVYTYRSGIKRLWLNLYGRKLLERAAHVIFSTEREREKAKWFYEGANTRVVHWPVDLIETDEKSNARAWLRARLELEPSAQVLLYFGRLHTSKRPLETIEAFAAAGVSGAHLVLVGPEGDVTLAACQECAGRLGIGSRVHPVGAVYGAEKNRFVLGADAYISLSYKENFGHTAAECLAAGTPVLLSPGNDLSPELEPVGCGWFLKTNRSDEAVDAIRSALCIGGDVRYAMGQRGRAFVRDECSEVGFAAALRALRDEAVANHR